jgi:predicted ATPase/DNA-binding CsgD family transcriptional regulator
VAEPKVAVIPAPTTPLLGRGAELAQVTDVLWNPDVRLVSLLGPGGIGKTRLAVEVAWALHAGTGFADGVWFVDLASVNDPELAPATVARAIGIVDMGTGDDVDRLCEAIRDRDMLLVLDNFERVTPATRFVAQLLAAAPRLSILATSRRSLHLQGEHEIVVPPLGSDDAVALFSARARAVNPGFELSATTTPIVESICAELDRLPLAIELAAARSKVLSPAELRSRLASRLDLLTRGPSDQPERLRSMHATITWSYDALPADVRGVFRHLAMFSGGWNLEAAEAVCQPAAVPMVDGLAVLLDHHLVQRDDTGAETRFGMFETVREFGHQELVNAGDTNDVARRHATHFLAFAHTAEREFHKADQAAWLDRVATEHDNIRAALQWALVEDPEMALDLAGTMWRFWVLRGYVKEGLGWLERSISAASDSPSTARARAMLGAGSMYEAIGDDEAAEFRYLAGLRDSEALDDAMGIALASRHLGNADLGRGRYDQATEWYVKARSVGEHLNDDSVIAGSVSNLGSVAYFQGDYARAEKYWTEAAAFYRRSSDSNRLASILNNLAELAALRGDPAVAVKRHEEVLELRRQLGDPIGTAQTLVNLGKAVQGTGDLARARAVLEDGLARLRSLGIERDIGACLYNMGLLARAEGRTAEAAELANEALSIKHTSDELFDLAQCLELIAGVGADAGLGIRSARVLGAAAALRRTIGARPSAGEPEADEIYATVRGVVGDDRLAAGIDEGETWALEHAVAEATEIASVVSSAAVDRVVTPLAERVSSEVSPAARRLRLTARELEVLGYLAQRYTDREIAESLTISLRTVTTHVGRILTKLGVDGRRQAAIEATRLGLLAS